MAEVSDDKSLPKESRKRLQIENAPHKSEAAALVTLANKISNLRDLVGNPPPGWSVEPRRIYLIGPRMLLMGYQCGSRDFVRCSTRLTPTDHDLRVKPNRIFYTCLRVHVLVMGASPMGTALS